MIGVPKGYQPTPEDAATIRAISELQFPLSPRRNGALFDGFVSNMVADQFRRVQPVCARSSASFSDGVM